MLICTYWVPDIVFVHENLQTAASSKGYVTNTQYFGNHQNNKDICKCEGPWRSSKQFSKEYNYGKP